jgi:hypothetical protein
MVDKVIIKPGLSDAGKRAWKFYLKLLFLNNHHVFQPLDFCYASFDDKMLAFICRDA